MSEDIPMVQPAGSGGDYPMARRARPVPPPPTPSGFGTLMRWLFRLALVISLAFNLILFFLYLPSLDGSHRLSTNFHSGARTASDKIAIVKVHGGIVEGLMEFAERQIRDAAQDDDVKAVVLQVNSPGGSVTASDRLHKQVMDLRDGKWDRQKRAKPVVVHMESIAASGGYYVAAPGQTIIAEPTTITGSIGVYASLFEVTEIAEKHGVTFNFIKKGELKGSGSPFKKMTPEERQEIDEMMEATFLRFQKIVTEGRDGQPIGKRLKYGVRDEIRLPSLLNKGETYVRHIADGGVFTSEQAKDLGLIDDIGYLDSAIAQAKKLANLPEARVIEYVQPVSLADLFGVGLARNDPRASLRLHDVPGATRRLWFVTPGYELAGIPLSWDGLR